MLPDFKAMGEVMAGIMALIERGVVALESINRHLDTIAGIEYRRQFDRPKGNDDE